MTVLQVHYCGQSSLQLVTNQLESNPEEMLSEAISILVTNSLKKYANSHQKNVNAFLHELDHSERVVFNWNVSP